MTEGGDEKDTILFGKYQLIRILGQGRSGTVYLAFHRELEEYRAIKRVDRSKACHDQFRKEALLLKRLRHPGIPIVYDLEEDSHFFYLIEEFLEGDSIYDLVRGRGPLNQDAVIRFGIQICDLVHYLHSAEATPILYLDLQPRNLLVCHGQVKLLDFDHSDTLTSANAAGERYGTEGFAAPEQRNPGRLGIYTDIYQIGAVLFYMAAGQPQTGEAFHTLPGQLGAVIHRCLQRDAALRYETAEDVREALAGLHSKTECLRQSKSPSLTIALAGARAGAGVTHIAIGLAVWLKRMGSSVLYEEYNRSNDVRAMGETLQIQADSYGIYTLRDLSMKPRYGEAVCLRPCSYPIIIRDYGTDLEAAMEEGTDAGERILLLVCGGKWWDRLPLPESAAGKGEPEEIIFLFNHAVPGAFRMPEGRGRRRCFRVPRFEDPFEPDSGAESFYRTIMDGYLPGFRQEERSGLWERFRKKGRRGRRKRPGSSV